MGGRPPKPVATHKLEGTYQKCRHEDRGTDLTPLKSIDCPKSISGKTKEIWDTIIPPLCEASLITIADIPILENAFLSYQFANEIYSETQNLSMEERRAFMRDWRFYLSEFEKIMMKFGVTPVEAAKIRGVKKTEADDTSVITALIGNG